MIASQPTLFIVATPIGTLADISPRAQQVLTQADFIICEDTRRTKELLLALKLQHGPLVSLHEHNEREKSQSLIERIISSTHQSAALVSDAGTPAISDPGAFFVAACHDAKIKVESLPGPSSLISAAAASGFLRPRIIFSGFLSRNLREQVEEFNRWKSVAPCLAICFESPHRVLATLKNAADVFPDSLEVCVSREISKKFEEHIRGSLDTVLQRLSTSETLKGECVISFDLSEKQQSASPLLKFTLDEAIVLAQETQKNNPTLKLKEICKKIADEHQLNAKELYNTFLERTQR